MLENLTIGDIAAGLGIIAGLIGSLSAIIAIANKVIVNTVSKSVKTSVEPYVSKIRKDFNSINKKIAGVQATADSTAKNTAQNYIKSFLSDLDSGKPTSQLEFECFFQNLEIFERYEGNGFIHAWIDRLTAQGKFNNAQIKILNDRNGRPKNHA